MKSVCGILIILVVLTTMLTISTFPAVAGADCPISEAKKCVEKCGEKVKVCEPGVCQCSK
uniref:CSab-Lyc-13 n=1 Tax=Lychas buchari TaxID=1330406 RepID=T1DEM2_9SCOR